MALTRSGDARHAREATPGQRETTRSATALPANARRVIAGTILLAGFSLVAVGITSGSETSAQMHATIFAVLAATTLLTTWFQTRSFMLNWNGQRLAVHADEAVLLIAFYLAPPLGVVAAAALGSLGGQLILRKPKTKLIFNVSAQLASTSVGALAYLALLHAGVTPLLAAAATPFAVSATNQMIIATLLSTFGTSPAWNPRGLLMSIAMASGVGVLAGVMTVSLYTTHPSLVILMIPVGWLASRALNAGYRQENETNARKAISDATRRMLEDPQEETCITSILDACHGALSPHAMGLQIEDGTTVKDVQRGDPSGAASHRLSAPFAIPGGVSGTLWISSPRQSQADVESERACLREAASALSLGLANARSLQRLARSERRLRDAFDAAPDPIFVLDGDLRILQSNHSSLAIFHAAGPFVGKSARALLDLPTGMPRGPIETRAVDARIGKIWEARLCALRLDDGTEGFVLMTHDVTDQRRLEREARVHEEALSRSERLSSLGTLVAGVAHEVNNPLAYMMASLDLVMLDIDDVVAELEASDLALDRVDLGETKRRLVTVQSGAQRIAQITKALKVLARPAGAKEELVRVKDVVQDLELLMRPTIPSSIELRIDCASEATVTGSVSDLQRALLNLAKNAVEAIGGHPGEVCIRVEERGGAVLIQVADDGPGMAADVRARIFTPFFTTKPDGTGLGLPTVFGIVNAHHGSIVVDSEPDKGTRFVITLPAATGRPLVPSSPRARGRHDVE